jgi:hypothetical protein
MMPFAVCQDVDRAERKTGFWPYLPSPGVLYTDPGLNDAGVVGRKLQIDGLSALVVGILPGSFQFPSEAEAWAPLSFTNDDLSPSRRGGHGLEVLAIVEVSGEVDTKVRSCRGVAATSTMENRQCERVRVLACRGASRPATSCFCLHNPPESGRGGWMSRVLATSVG